ncbi:MAG: hypothetical protein NTW86_18335 [Candidatus Sumerlaeota bacterium]|nr:hypothetical protein [Candidatus Sumerlaeota bacterium]
MVNAPGVYSPVHVWEDNGQLPSGHGGSRKDGALGKGVNILVVQGLITSPTHQWINSAPLRYGDQGLIAGAPGWYSISFQGTLLPVHERLRRYWEIPDEAGGMFYLQSIHDASPSYIPPDAPVTGANVVMHVEFRNDSNEWEDTGISDDAQFDIFDWHFKRDIANETELEQSRPLANCGYAAHHGYNGTESDARESPYGGWPIYIYDVEDESMDELSEVAGLVAQYAAIGRAVKYGGEVDHIELLTGNSGLTWSANTPADPGQGHWSGSSIGLYLQVHGPGGAGNCWWIDIIEP